MRLSELMIRDIRAEIEYGENKIVIKNPKGKVKEDLLKFFKWKIELNSANSNKKKFKKGSELVDNVEVIRLLIENLTNIDIDSLDNKDFKKILSNPSHELTRVLLYLSSIMQELVFEVMAEYNLQMRMTENSLLESETKERMDNVQNIVKEIKHRKLVDGKTV